VSTDESSIADRFGVVTTAEAITRGWTGRRLEIAARRGGIERLARGVYRLPGSGDDPLSRLCAQAAAAALAVPGAIASHRAAAALHRLPLLMTPDRACVTVPPRYRGDADCAHLHRAGRAERHHEVINGVPCTGVARTAVDVARECGWTAGLVVMDAAVNRALVTPGELEQCILDCAGWPGLRSARRAVAQCDGRAESPLETLSRIRLAATALPRPQLQTAIRSDTERFLARVDFYWDEFGVVGEADGRQKYVTANDLYREKQRQDALESAGLVVVRWSWSDLRQFGQVVTRLTRAMSRGLAPGTPSRRWRSNAA